jgi:DNA-directed RNA polymerase subunit K/omega
MQVFTPGEVSSHATNKYLSILIAAKYSRVLNEFPGGSAAREKKLTTRALEELTTGSIEYRVVPRARPE